MNDKKSYIICFISGKGGVGKTSITTSVGKILSLMGYKTLIIDSDLYTHGLTFLMGFGENKFGILELYNDFKGKKIGRSYTQGEMNAYFEQNKDLMICNFVEGLDYIQSTSIPSKIYSELMYTENDDINNFYDILLEYLINLKYYDYILIDTQAGHVLETRTSVKAADKTIIIMEPDPISTYATENLVSELYGILSRDNSYYIINKLSVEEVPAYNAIEKYLMIIRHLPPIPFDFEVRRAFLIRKIPIDENDPTPFMFGIINMLINVLVKIEYELKEYYEYLENKIKSPIKNRIEQIENDLSGLAIKETELKLEIESIREGTFLTKERNKLIYIFSITIISIILTFFIQFYLRDSIFRIIPMAYAIMSFIYGIYYYINKYEKNKENLRDNLKKLEIELANIREIQYRARKEYESYTNLLSTRKNL